MKPSLINFYYKYAAISLIALFAATQFILIIRHKSVFISDSYFYKHIYYQIKGDTYNEARQKIVSQVDLKNSDEITTNIFINQAAYSNSLTFFVKRPLYPLLVALISTLSKNEVFNFMFPVFLAYVGIVFLIYNLSGINLGRLFAAITSSLFIAFYPLLDWSTYALTDTIGAFFWILQVFLAYLYISGSKTKWLLAYAVVLALSLTNREQSTLMIPLFIILFILTKFAKLPGKLKPKIINLIVISVIFSLAYMMIMIILGQRSILETIAYTHNNFGLTSNRYSTAELIKFSVDSFKTSHLVFFHELIQHHWWFIISVISIMGIAKTLVTKGKSLIDLLLLSSGIASYMFVFIFPSLQYRYFFPVLFTIIYFAAKFIKEYFETV